MKKEDFGKKLTAVIFIALIFLVGIGSVVQSLRATKGSSAGAEAVLEENMFLRNRWIDVNGGFQRLLGSTYVKDPETDVYKMDDGSTIYALDKVDMEPLGKNLIRLYRETRKQGKDFLYVQLPFKAENADSLPVGITDHGNKNADDLLSRISEADVPHMDIRQEIQKAGSDHGSLFYKTDQHWLPETAMWAAGLIAERLEKDHDYPRDPELYDMLNYRKMVYPKWFLGSFGKRTGVLYAGVDDFSLIYPRKSDRFRFHAEAEKGPIDREGDFLDALCVEKRLEEKDYYGINCYATYIGGDYSINTVENLDCHNDVRLLLIRDSFSCAMEPFLCNQYRHVTAIDMRTFDAESVLDHIASEDYDVVVVAYNPSAFTEDQFSFFSK